MGTGEVEDPGLDWMAFMRTSTSVENSASVPVFLVVSMLVEEGSAFALAAEVKSVGRVGTWLMAFFAGRISGRDCRAGGG